MNYASENVILSDFERLIFFYQSKANDEEIGDCLTLFLIELMNVKKCISKRYVAVCLRNEFYRLIRNKIIKLQNETLFENELFLDSVNTDDYSHIFIQDVLKTLTETEKNVVVLRYIQGYSVSDIANFYKVSKPYISQIKKRALDKIKSTM